ncbi:MAG: SMI1/KNR4 family protein [Planctomycetia bacterium]|nr:SMI1/KNR4 family protein [Planctomycetia bacterium]
MSLQEMLDIILPPAKPLQVGTKRQLEAIEKRIGIQFPEDYKDFIFRYGSGNVAGFFSVLNPFSESWQHEIRTRCENLRSVKKKKETEVPFPIFPEKEGIFLWGADSNASEYYWLTQGKPDDWLTLKNHEAGPPWFQFKLPMTTFLAKVLTNRLKRFWPGDPQPFGKDELAFEPVAYR